MSVHLRASYAGEGSEVMSKSGNSRLETMKRQFNKKMGRRTLPTPQKINAASKMSPASETAQNDERLQKDSSHSNSSNSNAAPSTFNQSGAVIMRRPIRKELPTGVHRQSNRRKSAEAKLSESSKEEASSLAAQSNKKESGHKSLRALDRRTPVQSRHNQPKPRAIQMQMATSSARQVLENVLTREMRGVYVPRKRNDTAQSTEENIPDENLEGSTSTNDPQVLEEGPISPVPPSKESSNNQRSPFAGHSGLLPPGHVGNANIREKLRQHYRHNTAASKSEATKVQDNPTQESFTGESSSTAERNHPSTSNTNETILNKIRQKGPVVAKQMGSQSMEELENLAASPKKKKIPSQAKPSSRPGSPRTPRRRGSPITTGRTSPYAKRVGSPTSRGISRGRNPSPKGRNPSPNRRPPSPNTDGISPYSPDVTSKKISRVLKARLYLLQQNGPNSFRIGGDSPEHKYLVIVGPQTCNCGRGQFCVHVLFVMLRVFQLDSSSNLLWRRTLKNYEVESLFKSYHERCNNRISPKKKSRVQRLVSHLASGVDKHPDASSNSDDQSSSKGEEESCPICLLQMVDGESVTVCEVGCRNRLHTHCVNIWAEECRRNGGPLKCPLCRVIWKPAETTRGSGLGPLMVEIPQEYAEMADAWIQEFGWEMVSCLFSSHPNVRENALRRLSHDITGALLTNIQITSSSTEVGGHRSDDSDSSSSGVHTNHPSSSVANNPSIACCCAILAMVCSDPEYRVYITALRTLRAMMAYTQCRTTDDVTAFQNLLTPVIESILFKCADSNRRTVQLSVSTVMELCRGQTGELAVGKEIVSDDTLGVGDVDYLLSFLNFGNSPDSSSWQWMLGRLNAVGELFREFKRFLNPGGASSSEASDSSEGSRRLIKIANFAASCLSNTTQPRVGKIARRVFLQAYSFALSNPLVAARLESIVSEMEPESSQRLRRKIKSVKAMTSGQEVTEMPSASRDDRCDPNHSHSDDNFADNEVLDIHSPQQGTYPYLHNYPTSLVQPTPPTYPAPHRWYSPQRQSAPSSVPHYPTFGVNSWRGSLPVGQYTNVAPNSSVMWGNCEGETQATNHHPPSPCMGTHPPTPPPSSMDTANLDAAIEVSLFRPIRSMSPDPTPDEAGKVIAQFTNIPEQPPLSPPEQWNAEEEPVTRATNSDKVRRIRAKGGLNLPVTSKSEPVTPVSGSLLISPTKSEKPKRPSLLRLKSDSSAFRETQQRKVFRNSADLGAARESSRDRSSSRESSTSSTSCCEDFRRTSDRRMSVRELAESINRKQHRQDSSMKTNSSSSSSNSAPRKLPQPKRYDKQKSSGSGSILQEKQAWKSDTDDVVAHGRPLALKGAIERRGTVERYRDGLKHGHPPSSHPRKIREDNGRKMDEVRESGDLHISPFVGSSGSGRIPTRGILKNSGIPGPFTPSVTSVSTASEMVASATDSGFITDTNHFSDNSQAKSRKILSPESESPQEDIGHFDHVRDSISKMRLDDSLISPSEHSSASQRIPRRSGLPSSSGSRKPRALLNYHKQKSASLPRDPSLQDDPDSPTMTRSVEMEAPSTSASNEFNRCPSAPAATLLRAGEESSQNLPPNEEEGPEEISTASDITWSASESLSSSNVRRRGHPRKLPARPNRLSRRKGRDKLKKQVSPRLSSSVEDLLAESDHSLAEKTPVTFKSEIGVQTPGSFPHDEDPGTPASSNGHRLSAAPSVEGYEADLEVHCSCRMQIAEEEDKMFAHTLAVSYVQDALPLVPHLSFDDAEGDIVRVQSEHTSVEREYKENKQWSKGAQIGLGAFSACFQARDMFTGTLMAVKQVNYIRCSQLEQQQVLAVITEEIALMRNLNHPNIVRLHGVTKEGPLYNVFIEWCAGGSVSALLSHYGSFNEAVIANYALQLFRGLAYIHDQHLIHRDIKGANLLIDSTGQRLRISDFGAAARLASKGTGAGEFQGQLLGTIAFMAPEVLRGEQYGRSCDVWSCGCVVTEMATGKPPWEADMHSNHLALIFKIASSPTVPPIPDVLSPAMRDLCRRCLQTNPRDRPTASELLKHPVFIRW